MSHSRTNNFTYRLIFFFLAGKGGGGKKKRRHVVLLLFSLSKGNPGAAAWTWAHSDSEAGWKQDLRPRSLYLRVLRETPPNLSCHGPGPLFKRVTWALLDCELHLGSSQEARHCLWWIACAKTKRLRVCSEEIKAARWLSVSARTFFFRFFTSLSTMFRDGFSCFHWAVTPHVSRESLSHTGQGAGSHIRIPTQPSHPL